MLLKFGPEPKKRMQIWLFNQLVEEIKSALAWTHTQGGMQAPFPANHIKRHPLLHSCAGLLRTHLRRGAYRPPPPPPPPPLPFSRLCAASVPQSRVEPPDGEALSGPWVVWRTPPLILPFESSPRTMANTCEPPSVASERRAGGRWWWQGVGGGEIDVECRGRGECGGSGAMCLRTSFSHRCLGYMSRSANGWGVVSPVLPTFA